MSFQRGNCTGEDGRIVPVQLDEPWDTNDQDNQNTNDKNSRNGHAHPEAKPLPKFGTDNSFLVPLLKLLLLPMYPLISRFFSVHIFLTYYEFSAINFRIPSLM